MLSYKNIYNLRRLTLHGLELLRSIPQFLGNIKKKKKKKRFKMSIKIFYNIFLIWIPSIRGRKPIITLT